MRQIKYVLVLLICLGFSNCKNDNFDFQLNKRYWDLNDYDEAIRELRFGYKDDEKLPTLSDPEGRKIVLKLTDEQNFAVVLDDEELGLKHRNKVATDFFNHWTNMNYIYNAIDRKDKYVYDKEMLAVWRFGLGLQIKYFKLGNDQIIESVDDPNSKSVKRTVDSNVQTLIENYLIYLDKINEENAFSEEGKAELAKGIDDYFPKLIETFPDANYSSMKRKAKLMLKKSKSDKIKSSLNRLISLIDSKSSKDS